MRILYLCSDFGIDPAGTKGASIHLREITRALCGLGCDVVLLSPKAGPGDAHPVRRLLPGGCPPADEIGRLLKSWMMPRGLGAGLAQELRPLLYNAWVLDRAKAALADQPVAAIVERLSLMGHVGVDLADALQIPLIVEVNALLTDECRQFRSLQLAQTADEIERRVLERAAAILAVSRQLADQIAARGIPASKIHVVPNGANVEKFRLAPPRTQCRRALEIGDEFVVGFVGSLKPWHGADVLLNAFARLRDQIPHSRLLLVGAGPEEFALRELAHTLKLGSSATFTGAIPHDEVPAYIRAMDVAVAPYRPQDGFYFSPIKLFEYMAAGTCVIASRIGQCEEVIHDRKNGLLCAPGDAAALADTLEVVARDASLRRSLADAALEEVTSKYTWQHAAQQVLHVVEPLTDEQSGLECRAREGAPYSALVDPIDSRVAQDAAWGISTL